MRVKHSPKQQERTRTMPDAPSPVLYTCRLRLSTGDKFLHGDISACTPSEQTGYYAVMDRPFSTIYTHVLCWARRANTIATVRSAVVFNTLLATETRSFASFSDVVVHHVPTRQQVDYTLLAASQSSPAVHYSYSPASLTRTSL